MHARTLCCTRGTWHSCTFCQAFARTARARETRLHTPPRFKLGNTTDRKRTIFNVALIVYYFLITTKCFGNFNRSVWTVQISRFDTFLIINGPEICCEFLIGTRVPFITRMRNVRFHVIGTINIASTPEKRSQCSQASISNNSKHLSFISMEHCNAVSMLQTISLFLPSTCNTRPFIQHLE